MAIAELHGQKACPDFRRALGRYCPASSPSVSVSAPSLPPLLLPTLPLSCLVWRSPQSPRTEEEEERPVLPCYEGWGCDWGLPLLELGVCLLPCLAMLLSGVESWKGALPPPTSMQDLGLR